MKKPEFSHEEGDCGIAVLKYAYSSEVFPSYEALRQEVALTSKGLSVSEMQRLAERYGRNLRPFKVAPEGLNRLRGGWILLCKNTENEGHYVFAVRRIMGLLWLVMDPIVGYSIWSHRTLVKRYSGIILDPDEISTPRALPQIRVQPSMAMSRVSTHGVLLASVYLVSVISFSFAAGGVFYLSAGSASLLLSGEMKASEILFLLILLLGSELSAALQSIISQRYLNAMKMDLVRRIAEGLELAPHFSYLRRTSGAFISRWHDADLVASYFLALRVALPSSLFYIVAYLVVSASLFLNHFGLVLVYLILVVSFSFFGLFRVAALGRESMLIHTSLSSSLVDAYRAKRYLSKRVLSAYRHSALERYDSLVRCDYSVLKYVTLVTRVYSLFVIILVCLPIWFYSYQNGGFNVGEQVVFVYVLYLFQKPVFEAILVVLELRRLRAPLGRARESAAAFEARGLSDRLKVPQSPASSVAHEGEVLLIESLQVVHSCEKVVPSRPFSLRASFGARIVISGDSASGKSSILRAIAGFEALSIEGAVSFPYFSVEPRVALVPQSPEFPSCISLEDFVPESSGPSDPLDLHSQMYSLLLNVGFDEGRAGELDRQLSQYRPVLDGLSGGERARLALALALLGEPDILLLDEVTAGLSERETRVLIDYVSSLKLPLVVWASHDPIVLAQGVDVVL